VGRKVGNPKRSAEFRDGAAADTRERLLRVAKTVFSKKGFDGATVQDLSRAARVNVSLVSYYFGGKEGLYRACLEQFGTDKIQAAARVLTPAESPEDFRVKLRLWAQQFLDCLIEEEELTKILHRELVSDMSLTKDIFQKTFVAAYESLVKFFQAAQSAKILKPEIDTLISAVLLYGGIMNRVAMDQLSREVYKVGIKDPSWRQHFVDETLMIFLKGII